MVITSIVHFQQDGSGKIDISELRDCIVELNLPIQRELLESLLLYCDINNDGQIDYLEFSNFLNWKDKMPSGIRSTLEQKRRDSFASEQTEDNEERTTPIGDENDNVVNAEDTKQLSVASRESTPQKLQKQIDKAVIDYKTSSQMINSTVGKVTTGGKCPAVGVSIHFPISKALLKYI